MRPPLSHLPRPRMRPLPLQEDGKGLEEERVVLADVAVPEEEKDCGGTGWVGETALRGMPGPLPVAASAEAHSTGLETRVGRVGSGESGSGEIWGEWVEWGERREWEWALSA